LENENDSRKYGRKFTGFLEPIEIAFKIGNIHSHRLNELYEEWNPNFANIFQDL